MQRVWKVRGRGGTSGEAGLKSSRNQGGSFLTVGSFFASVLSAGWRIDLTLSCPFLAATIIWPPAATPLGKCFLSAMLGDALTPLPGAGSGFGSAASPKHSAHHDGTMSDVAFMYH